MDLSRCLDGRLPGARRAVVMKHVDACSKCTQVWEDMQAAQSLVFRLEQPAVSPHFRDDVWERIHSGEGTPDVLLRQPITSMTKVRYGLVGAAAAAAFLVGLRFLTMDDSPAEINTRDAKVVDLPGVPPNGEHKPLLRTVAPFPEPPTSMVSDELATAGLLATQTVARVASAAKRLKIRTPAILNGETKDRVLWREVNQDVRTIDGGLHILDTLQRKEIVRLEPSSLECMTAARTTLDLFRSGSRKQTVNLVRSLDNCPLEGLTKVRVQFSIQQMRQPQGMLMDMIANDPMLGRMLMQLGIVGSPGSAMTLPGMHFAPGPVQHSFVWRIQRMPRARPNQAPTEQGSTGQAPTTATPPRQRKTLRVRSGKN